MKTWILSYKFVFVCELAWPEGLNELNALFIFFICINWMIKSNKFWFKNEVVSKIYKLIDLFVFFWFDL